MSGAELERLKEHFDSPYLNQGMQRPAAEDRVANALDYIAYQLGEIRRNLEEINERQKG